MLRPIMGLLGSDGLLHVVSCHEHEQGWWLEIHGIEEIRKKGETGIDTFINHTYKGRLHIASGLYVCIVDT